MTFYTPTYLRPTYLAICRQSVQAQACRDFQHMVIVDDAGIGVDGMFRDIPRHADQVRGEYVFILADDDRLLSPDGLEQVRAFARAQDNPAVLIVRNYKWGDVYPTIWQQEPVLGAIDTGNFIVRSDVFRENADRFGQRYEGDYDFIHHLWERGYPFAWFDYLFSEMQVGGKGRTEVEIMAHASGTIRVRALKSFAARVGGMSWSANKGQELDMPPGMDWIRAGLVEAVLEPKVVEAPETAGEVIETATIKPKKAKAVKRGSKVNHGGG